MSELLFECYNVPSVCYGVDCLFSYYKNLNGLKDGLLVSCGYHATHVIPVLHGKILMDKARRLNLGGANMISFLHRLLQLKYPAHINAMTISRAEELLHEHSSIACDYGVQMKSWADLGYYEQHVKRFQLPYNQNIGNAPVLSTEQKLEKRKDLGKRLGEMNSKRRGEKLVEQEAELNQLLNIRELYDDEEEFNEEFDEAMHENQIESLEDLEKMITALSSRIERAKQRLAEQAIAPAAPVSVAEVNKVPQPPEGLEVTEWVESIKNKRQSVLEKRTARKQRRKDLAKRHTAAAQERMRLISQLAKKDKGVDDFGMRDEDWEIYKTINKDDNNSDSDMENELLINYELILRHHDPHFEEPAQIPQGGIAENHQVSNDTSLFLCFYILFNGWLVFAQVKHL